MGNVASTSAWDYRPSGLPAATWPRARLARWFLGLGMATVAAAGGLAAGLMRVFGRVPESDFHFPAAFGVTTLLLISGSLTTASALRAVRRERQPQLRRRLIESLVIGAVFIGMQTYALWTILPAERSADAASAGVAPFAVMLAALHGFHFLVATLFVAYVTVQAHAGRYDHEYHWGVTVCTWFWHALGIAWAAILAVYSIVVW